MRAPAVSGRTLLQADELRAIVEQMGRAIARDHPEGVVLVGILKGSVCLVADLVRHIATPCSVDFLGLMPYGAGGTRIALSKDLDVDVSGLDVVIAVDIVDSGLTVSYVRRLLTERGARSADICALVDRKPNRLLPIDLRYVGLSIGNEYIIGYGLDFEERYRNIPSLFATEPDALRGA
ncbi:MAG: phosphoribosyltransferase family protein [Actinomycetota bacterium]|nr:phosphoribosyltransferase family protein [Actinomycetota bacterium]